MVVMDLHFPVYVSRVVREQDLAPPAGMWAEETLCAGARYHSPSPLVVHEVEITDTESVFLCGTCLDNFRVYRAILEAHEGNAPWPLRREFGNLIRALVERAWEVSHG